jgi:hypothetical protein
MKRAILAKRVSASTPSVRGLRRAIPKAPDALLSQALSKARAERHSGVAEFAEGLGRTTTGPEWEARPIGPLRLMGLYLLSTVAVLGLARLLTTRLELPGWVMPGGDGAVAQHYSGAPLTGPAMIARIKTIYGLCGVRQRLPNRSDAR